MVNFCKISKVDALFHLVGGKEEPLMLTERRRRRGIQNPHTRTRTRTAVLSGGTSHDEVITKLEGLGMYLELTYAHRQTQTYTCVSKNKVDGNGSNTFYRNKNIYHYSKRKMPRQPFMVQTVGVECM